MGAGEPDMRNPVGVGRRNQNGSQDIPCPQLLPINMQSPELGPPLPVLGLGPLAPSWQPRLACAGTYDERWKSTRWPYLPLDFDFQFYNAAPNDQSFAGFAKGDRDDSLVSTLARTAIWSLGYREFNSCMSFNSTTVG